TATEPPFSVDWSSTPPGSHIARATVFDTDGRFSSDAVSVTIEAAVSVNGSDSDWIALGVDPVLDSDGLQSDPELALDRFLFYEDDANYYFAFDAGARSKRVAYGVYLDLDAARGNQMTDQMPDPLGHAVRGSRQHTPEIVFYFVHDGQAGWTANSPSFFRLSPGSDEWPIPGWPATFDFAADTANGFLEFSFPKIVITDYAGSQGIFAELFTVGEADGAGASESIPSDDGIAFTEENTSTETTILSAFHNFTFPAFDGEKIVIDGNRFDWLRSGIIPAVNTDKLQTEPELALDRLFVTHDLDNYYFAFITTPGSKQVTFGLYVDSGSHEDPAAGPGGPGSANGNAVEAEGFLPDVQIYFDNDTTGAWTIDTPRYYVWDNGASTWGTVSAEGPLLPEGSQFATAMFGKTSWVEFSIRRDAAGLYDSETLDMQLFSVGATPGAGASASLPSDPNIRFTTENTSTDVTVLSAPYRYSTQPVIVNIDAAAELPVAARLFQIYPNPVSTTTTISFTVDRSQRVRLAAYDLLGRLQVVLFDEMTGPGERRVALDASGLASGTYILRLEGDGVGESRKMVVVR
ncbi:MAG: T9SS type A sorting domain-containing protein, partial [Rhodothermia bacterium]